MPKINLLRATSTFAGMTLLSRLLGFARDVILAYVFGATAAMDAFLVAFKIPNFMRRLFAEGAFSQAVVPILAEYHAQHDDEATRDFLANVSGCLSMLVGIAVLLMMWQGSWVVWLFAPGFAQDGDTLQQAAGMLTIMAPYLWWMAMTTLGAAVLHTMGFFAIPASAPLMLNVILIVFAWYLRSYFHPPIVALAWGVLLAGLVQCLFQWPLLYRSGWLPRPKLDFRHRGVIRVFKAMLPALFGVMAAQINLIVSNVFASFLEAGSVSWLYYADRLMNFPLGVMGVALATTMTPALAALQARNQTESFTQVLCWGTHIALLLGLPSAVGLVGLAGPVIVTLFFHGAFDLHDVHMTQAALQLLGLGVPAFILVKVLASGFYAQHDLKTPLHMGMVAVLCNLVLIVCLVGPYAHLGLAAALTGSAYINAMGLAWLLYRRGHRCFAIKWPKAVTLLLANGVLAGWLALTQGALDDWLHLFWWQRFGWLSMLMMGAVFGYACIMWLGGYRWGDLKAPSMPFHQDKS